MKREHIGKIRLQIQTVEVNYYFVKLSFRCVCVCVYVCACTCVPTHTMKRISFVTITSALLFLKGMQNPVRSRLSQAARYFLKEVDFDIGRYPWFHVSDGVGAGAAICI